MNHQTRDIVFSSGIDNDEDIYLMNVYGENIHRLTISTKKGVSNRTPEWSPDGAKIAYQSNEDGPREIYLLDVNTKEKRQLTNGPEGNSNHPSWSADGKSIVFVSVMNGGMKIFTIDIDGQNQRLITPEGIEGINYFNPSYSFDCKQVYFVLQIDKDTPDQLYRMDVDGCNPQKIGPSGLSIFEYDISPDGKTIVFDAKVDTLPPLSDWDIFTMDIDGTNIKRITNLKAMSSRPKWLSDGKTIVFHANRFGDKIIQPSVDDSLDEWFSWWNEFEICTMDFDGKNVKRLTNNKLRDLHPDG